MTTASQNVSDEAHTIASEPLVDLADAWTDVPESTVVECPAHDELRPFTPCR